jgi:amidohydrolase
MATTVHADQRKGAALAHAEAVRDAVTAVAKDIHAHPEIGYQEHHASGVLADLLAQLGFAVTRGVGETPTAFRAERGQGKPSIAILAEYDALPGLGHACGHNLIAGAAVIAGAAAAAGLGDAPGRVLVIGTPAEEGKGGKIRLLRAGVFGDVDAAIMFHPSSRNTSTHWALARSVFQFTFTGRAAHAAAAPDQGINALDAFVLAYAGLSTLRQQVRDGTRIHCILREGGQAANIIPERSVGELMVRARAHAYLQELVLRVKAVFEGAARATGCTVELVETDEAYADMRNSEAIVEAYRANAAALNITLEELAPWQDAGSTDMANISHTLPAIHPTIQIADGVVWHTRDFAEAANTPRAYQAMLLAGKALALTALDLLTDPELLRRAKAAASSA